MTRAAAGFCAAALMGLAGCAGPGGALSSDDSFSPQRGIDADIAATHDSGAPTIRNEGPRGSELWRITDPHPVGR